LHVWDSASRPVGGLGRAGLNTVSERKPCKTGLSEGQRALIEPVIAAWKAAHPSVSGHRGVGRLIGLDLARGLAVFGLYAVHVGPAPRQGDVTGFLMELAQGRAPRPWPGARVFHPVQVPSGTATIGARRPAVSLTSASTAGTSTV
jgi:hypothetical protein